MHPPFVELITRIVKCSSSLLKLSAHLFWLVRFFDFFLHLGYALDVLVILPVVGCALEVFFFTCSCCWGFTLDFHFLLTDEMPLGSISPFLQIKQRGRNCFIVWGIHPVVMPPLERIEHQVPLPPVPLSCLWASVVAVAVAVVSDTT